MVRYRTKNLYRSRNKRIIALFTVLSMLLSNLASIAETNQTADDSGAPICGIMQHEHTEECYENVLICEQDESETRRIFHSMFDVHKHTGICYDGSGNLICGRQETDYFHTHNEYCQDADGSFVCGLETRVPHTHTDTCYDPDGNLICGEEEKSGVPTITCSTDNWTEEPGHHHDESCYTKNLICELEEHVHGPECYGAPEAAEEPEEEQQPTEAETGTDGKATAGEESAPDEGADGDEEPKTEEPAEEPVTDKGAASDGQSTTDEESTSDGQAPADEGTTPDGESPINEETSGDDKSTTDEKPGTEDKTWEGDSSRDDLTDDETGQASVTSDNPDDSQGQTEPRNPETTEEGTEGAAEGETETGGTTLSGISDSDLPAPAASEPEVPSPDASEDPGTGTDDIAVTGTDDDSDPDDIQTPTSAGTDPESQTTASVSEFALNDTILTAYYGSDEVITIPEGITQIGKRAFYGNKTIIRVNLPDSVEVINSSAFAECSNLEQVILSEQSRLKVIGVAAFKNDRKLDTSFADHVQRVIANAFDCEEEGETEDNPAAGEPEDPSDEQADGESEDQSDKSADGESKNTSDKQDDGATEDPSDELTAGENEGTGDEPTAGETDDTGDETADEETEAPGNTQDDESKETGAVTDEEPEDDNDEPDDGKTDDTGDNSTDEESEEVSGKPEDSEIGTNPEGKPETGAPEEPEEVSETEEDKQKEEETETTETTDKAFVTTIEAKDASFAVFVSFSSKAGIPENAELIISENGEIKSNETTSPKRKALKKAAKPLLRSNSAEELHANIPSLTSWHTGEETPDLILYQKTLDISLMVDGEKIEPNPGTEVTVSVILPGIEAGQNIEVRHITDEGSELLESTNDAGTITFTTDSFSLFEFISRAQELSFQVNGWTENTFYGKTANQEATSDSVTPDEVTEGLEVLEARSVPRSGDLWMTVHRTQEAELGELESIDLYTVDGGLLGGMIRENISTAEVLRFNTADLSGVALVKDSGLRHRTEELENVTLDGMMPKNAIASATDVTEDYKEFRPDEEKETETIAAYDISIINNGKEYQPGNNPVSVTIQDDAILTLTEEKRPLTLWHILENGNREKVTDYTIDGNSILFDATGFSVYVLVGDVHIRTYTFYIINEYLEYVECGVPINETDIVYKQYVKTGEQPIAPQNPVNPQDPNATFAGWYQVTNPPLDATSVNFLPEPFDFNSSFSQDETVDLYAKYSDYAYVIFHSQYDNDIKGFPVAFTERVELEQGIGTIDISDFSVSYDGGIDKKFDGWSRSTITVPGSSADDNGDPVEKVRTEDDGTLVVTSTLHLYPIYTQVYWLQFYSGPTGSGSTYYAGKWYFNGEGPNSLSGFIPSRDPSSSAGAYSFAGWYAENNQTILDTNGEVISGNGVQITDEHGNLLENSAAGIRVENGTIQLTDDITLYAAWTQSNEANYTLVVVKQKAGDPDDGDASNNTYEFSESFILTAPIGSTVAASEDYRLLNEDENYHNIHPDITVSGENNPYYGYTYNSTNSTQSVSVAADGSSILFIRYDWSTKPDLNGKKYSVTFADTLSGEFASESLPQTISEIPYGTILDTYVPANPVSRNPNAYSFTGWYADKSCTTRAFFHEPSPEEKVPLQIKTWNPDTQKNEWDGHSYQYYVVYDTMPGANLTVYAGWELQWYVVTIDPNYGALAKEIGDTLTGTGATWFWSAYGELIQEYTTVTRSYVESDSGTWYYVNHAGNGTGGTVWPDRYTYYTQDPAKATEFVTFEPVNENTESYRYSGWYEVKADGSEELFDFDKIVDHNITLKLHWTKIGTFYLQYEPGLGKLNKNDKNEKLYVNLDDGSYADDSEVVITRTAIAPTGYSFIGWRVRGDTTETIYQPGQILTLRSDMAITVQGKRTIFLEAVYKRVPTATIVYHTNGGVISNINDFSYGSPAPTVIGNLTEGEGSVTVSKLENNSEILLSNGAGLAMNGAVFTGWSNKPVYNPDTTDSELYDPAQKYYIDNNEPNDLYAVWQLGINYHLNNNGDSTASFGDGWGSEYSLSQDGTTYSRQVYRGNTVAKPTPIPTTGAENRMFRYWATQNGSIYTQYDFSQPINDTLDLYAYWAEPEQLTVHAVDASEETIVNKDSDWNVSTLSIGATHVILNGTSCTATIPAEYHFAFATVLKGSDLQALEEKHVSALYFNASDGKVHVIYESGEDTALRDNEAVYFVYFRDRTLQISYKAMSYNGALNDLAVDSAAPASADVPGNGNPLDMPNAVTGPLAWASGLFTHYSYAIGGADSNGNAVATNASELSFKTSASDSDTNRPALQIRGTWRGFQYSTDGGSTWINSENEYEAALYVLYYIGDGEPTIVTFDLETIGLKTDMNDIFEFDYWIEEVFTADYTDQNTSIPYHAGESRLIYATRDPDLDGYTDDAKAISLKDGATFSTFLYTTDTSTQRVTIVQKEKEYFTTCTDQTSSYNPTNLLYWDNLSDSTDRAYSYVVYKNDESFPAGGTHVVKYTNTRQAVNIELHVAHTNITDGSLIHNDGWRNDEKKDVILPLGETIDPREQVGGSDLVNATAHPEFAFGAIFYGTQDNGIIIPSGDLTVASVACEPITDGSKIYAIYAKDAAGNRMSDLDGLNLYYLYYPKLTIYYMKEGDTGSLTKVMGSTDGISESDTLTLGGEVVMLNGVTVKQEQRVGIPQEGLTIAQTVSDSCFNIPPLLDDKTQQRNLVYTKLAAAPQTNALEIKTNTSDFNASGSGITETLTLYIGFVNNKLQWRFEDETDYVEISNWPVIYAIYQDRGYDVIVEKNVSSETGYNEPFTVTLKSTAISRTKYAVEGTGQKTVAAIPYDGTNPGSLELEVVNKSVIRISGLSGGNYTFTESGKENYTLTAKTSGETAPVTDAEIHDISVSEAEGSFALNERTLLKLTNKPDVICRVGTQEFTTITSAIKHIESFYQNSTGAIEMLVDYYIPASDAPIIPSYCNITLKSKEGEHYTITRRFNFDDGAIFSNSGTLTLQDITIDGGHTVDSAILDNSGTLTLGSGATLQNGHNRGNGGAINSWKGSVIVNGATITGCSANRGGAIYATTDTVEIISGCLSNNSANYGGALCYEGNDIVTVSGGIFENNAASENGGAIYMASGAANMTGGTIGSEDENHANQAKDGGGIYAENAYINISGGTIKYNKAAGNGGAVNMQTLTITISGGEISHNTAGENGGAVWSGTGEVRQTGGSITYNTAVTGNGGGICTNKSAVNIDGGSQNAFINYNTAGENGGGIYAGSGTISVAGSRSTVSNNQTQTGNGGGVYASTGDVTITSSAKLENNISAVNGGALWAGAGSTTLTSVILQNNTALNGAAVFGDKSSITFDTCTIQSNSASAGGAAGIGDISARLYFKGNTKIKDNIFDGKQRNVYLDQDTDAIINATGLGNSASIGIYVPDKNVTAGTETVNLFNQRGVPSAFFGSYTNDSNVGKFINDRLPGLSVEKETASKRLYWGKSFQVEVRYMESYKNGFPPTASSSLKKTISNYFAPSFSNAISVIADDLYSNAGNTDAVFGHAFVEGATSFDDYITDVNWDSENNRWNFVKRNGEIITGNKIIIYYTLPAYISIENNTASTFTINPFAIADKNVINSSAQTGYGYGFAKNGTVENELYPLKDDELVLTPGKSIRVLFPGGRNADYSLTGSFSDSTQDIPYRRTTEGEETITQADTGHFTLTGKTLNDANLYEIIFGGASPICRIVTDEISGVQQDEISGNPTSPNAEGKVEYPFKSLNQAIAFIQNHSLSTAEIGMLVDYIIPAADVVRNLPVGYDITFSTAIGGDYRYSDDIKDRATVSRASDNKSSFITVTDGKGTTKLTTKNLIFDGKSFGGDKINGGIINTNFCNVEIINVDFNNCMAQFGGGIFIKYVTPKSGSQTPSGWLTVIDSNFTNCQSTASTDKYGGGAIWTSVKDLTIGGEKGCTFKNCEAAQQGGAVFHFIGGEVESSTNVTNCTFDECKASAAGSMESGAKNVNISYCTFLNSTAKTRNAGALNIWALDKNNTSVDCYVTLEHCTFENCYALLTTNSNGNGGAVRSTATHNTFIDCTFTNTSGNDGGAINVFNENAVDTNIANCYFNSCHATNRGGAIYCTSKELIISGTSNLIKNCYSTNAGGAIYHGKNLKNSQLSIAATTIDNCYSENETGGGVYSVAQTMTLAEVIVQNCASPKQGGGLYLAPGDKSGTQCTLSITDSTIQNNHSTGNGAGLYYSKNNGFLTIVGSTITGNTSKAMGGGAYTDAKTANFKNSIVNDNTSTDNGGGICHNLNSQDGTITLDNTNITGNVSGGKGGGIYTLANLAFKNTVTVSDNLLSTTRETASNAAGVYMTNSRILTAGENNAAESTFITIKHNLTVDGVKSDLRLPETTSGGKTVNSNSVRVNCSLVHGSGDSQVKSEICVVNAAVKLTQFGLAAQAGFEGFTDLDYVFKSDDESPDTRLYGIIDRTDESGTKIIWGADPICKITDANGRLLYLDQYHARPAVFDMLDNGTTTENRTSAFGVLRAATPQLYNVDGSLYTGSLYQVKMLVENYVAENKITTPQSTERTITLTTAKGEETLYPYRGRTGTRCTVLRGTTMNSNNSFLLSRCNMMLQAIVLDGGSKDGVTAGDKTRIIEATNNNTTLKLGQDATLQNASIIGDKGNGGGIYLNNGAKLTIAGGSIRECSAKNGGGVYIDGDGTVTMSAGTITRCAASENGGGVFFNRGTTPIEMNGGTISRCSAKKGGGIYLNSAGATKLEMNYGNIMGNTATETGGGIAVAGNQSRLYFYRAPYVNSNTVNGNANNVEMNQGFTRDDDNPNTIIVSRGLIRGATIGVYVPGEDNNNDVTSLYDRHGAYHDPFATFEDGGNTGLNFFINDRNGMKGQMLDKTSVTDKKIYWEKIYALVVTKRVLSDAPEDLAQGFIFTIQLSGQTVETVGSGVDPHTLGENINGTFGEATFINGKTTFTLSNGQTMTADLLPLGLDYEVTEFMSDEQMEKYKTSSVNGNGVYSAGRVATGKMSDEDQYAYVTTFSNLSAICKITDGDTLLYYERDGEMVPAVYSQLVTAFNQLNQGIEWYYKDGDGYYRRTPRDYQIQMLIPDYEMSWPASLGVGKKVVLTTADPTADDGFPYVGGNSKAVITRHYNGVSMLTTYGDLTLGKIILDGGKGHYSSNADGGIIMVSSNASLTVGTGAALRNSVTTGHGAGVYLAEGGTMNISGSPAFSNNITTNEALGNEPTNGGDGSVYASGTVEQDIYIQGYQNTDATSLVVTGNLDLPTGSIWVWTEKKPHQIQNQQFAIMDNGSTFTGLEAFRNAQPDGTTENPMTDDTTKYLYGIAREGKVYWSGGMNLTVSKSVVSIFQDPDSFTFTVSGLDGDYCQKTGCDYVIYKTTDGTNWTATSNSGKKKATGVDKAISFSLANNEKIIISIPRGLTPTVKENDSGPYAPSYQIDNEAAADGTAASNHRMDHDTAIKFTNTRKTQNVTISKALVDAMAADATTFHFTAMLEYKDAGVSGYTLYSENNNSIVTADGTGSDPAGRAAFTLSPTNSAAASIVLTVPYGTKLTVTEDTSTVIGNKTVEEVYDTTVRADNESEITGNGYTISEVTSDQTLNFTNKRKGANLTITKNVTGEMGDLTKSFTFAVSDLPTGESYSYTKQSTTDGSNWSNIENGTGTLSNNDSFTLTHFQRIVIADLPLNRAITFRETNENYTTTWSATDTAAVTPDDENPAAATITLTGDGAVTVTNDLKAVAPTGIDTHHIPYLLMLAAGLFLMFGPGRAGIIPVKRRRSIRVKDKREDGYPKTRGKPATGIAAARGASYSQGDPEGIPKGRGDPGR